jgi:hypothetical protein
MNNFFNIIFYQLANKTRNLLFAIQLLIYVIYGDRTNIIGWVGFVVNILNRPTDVATVQRPKKCVPKKNYFSSAFDNVKLPFSLGTPKKDVLLLLDNKMGHFINKYKFYNSVSEENINIQTINLIYHSMFIKYKNFCLNLV